jgi:hypothetical protein
MSRENLLCPDVECSINAACSHNEPNCHSDWRRTRIESIMKVIIDFEYIREKETYRRKLIIDIRIFVFFFHLLGGRSAVCFHVCTVQYSTHIQRCDAWSPIHFPFWFNLPLRPKDGYGENWRRMSKQITPVRGKCIEVCILQVMLILTYIPDDTRRDENVDSFVVEATGIEKRKLKLRRCGFTNSKRLRR